MANIRGKAIDNTHLSINQAEQRGFIHRDYIAHCLRWSHIIKHMYSKKLYETADILDIGCGKEAPFLKTLYSSKLIPKTGSYTGIDINQPQLDIKISDRFDYELIGKQDVCDYDFGESTFDIIICLEVLEHVEPEHSFRILKRISELLVPGTGVAFISTPNYDSHVGAAGNHVNEMSYDGLSYLINKAGLLQRASYGTFASQRDYKGLLSDAEKEVFDSLSSYYDSNYLATLLAPLYPKQSRNAMRVLYTEPVLTYRDGKVQESLYQPCALDKRPFEKHHSSSDKWTNFIFNL